MRPPRPHPDPSATTRTRPHPHHRRRAGGARHGVPPQLAGHASWSSTDAGSATSGGVATPRLVLNTPAKYDALPGLRFPAPPRLPDRRTCSPTTSRSTPAPAPHPRRGGRALGRSGRRTGLAVRRRRGTYPRDNVVVATGGDTTPAAGHRRPHRPRDPPAPLQRLQGPGPPLPGPVLVVARPVRRRHRAGAARAGREVASGARSAVPVEIDSRAGSPSRSAVVRLDHVLTERTRRGARQGRDPRRHPQRPCSG